MSPVSLAHLHKTITMMVMRTIRIKTMAPATPPNTGPMMDGVVADDAVVRGDVEPVAGDVSEPVVGGAVVGPVVAGPVVVGRVVVGGAVGGAVVGGTLGLGVGTTLTSDAVKSSMPLPLPLATVEVVLGRLSVVGRLVLVVRLGVVVGLAEADGLRMIVELSDWPGKERSENRRLTVFERIGYY